jgi:hypothetical protein
MPASSSAYELRPVRRERNAPDGSRNYSGGRSAPASLQQHRCRCLGNSVGHTRHAEHPDPRAMILRYLHRPHRPGQIAPGTHPIPQLVEVVAFLVCEPGDAHGVHARRPSIGPDLLPRPINEALVDLKRLHHLLWSAHQLLPRRVDLKVTWPAQPLRSIPITGRSPLLRAGPPLCLAVLCPPRFLPLRALPLAARA